MKALGIFEIVPVIEKIMANVLVPFLECMKWQTENDSLTNALRVFHVETTWKRWFSRRFSVEYTWCACMMQSTLPWVASM